MSQQTGYGTGSPKINLAPVPFSTRKTFDQSDYQYDLGQTVLESVSGRWIIYEGDGIWTLFAGGPAQSDILSINDISPDSAGNFIIETGDNLSATPVTNGLSLSLSGLANHALVVGSGASSFGSVPIGLTGYFLLSGGSSADPSFSAILSSNEAAQKITIGGDPSIAGQLVQLEINNNNNTDPASGVRIYLRTGGAIAGDSYTIYDPGQGDGPGGPLIEEGFQNSSKKYVITVGGTVGMNISGTVALSVESVTGNISLGASNTNVLAIKNVVVSGVGAAGGASALPATPLGYIPITINGTAAQIPYYLPA